jgi:hypothetical protein
MWKCSRRTSSLFAPIPRRMTVMPPLLRSSRRPAPQLSEHPAPPFSLKACARAPVALRSSVPNHDRAVITIVPLC